MKKILSFSFLLFLFVFFSCKDTSYVPHSQNIPLFTDKKQIRVTPAFTNRSIDVGFAISPVRNFGTMLNLQVSLNSFVPEIGVGGYIYKHPLVLECYTGYAYAYKHLDDSSQVLGTRSIIDIQGNRYFVQPIVGFHFNEHFECALSAKTSYWDMKSYYFKLQGFNTYGEYGNIPHATQLTIEPALTVKGGWKFIRIMVQGGIYYNLYQGSSNPDLYYSNTSPYFLKVGFTLPIVVKSRSADE